MTPDPAPHSPRPSHHPPVRTGRVGVLLVNLGTPDATDYWSMRRYLKQFLGDRRVVETPRVIWWFVLNLIILTFRPSRSGRKYDTVWNRERNEGPLKTITRAQSDALDAWVRGGGLGAGGDKVVVDWAMRYGNPSIASRIDAMHSQGCERILVVPLYPQYSASTSATVADEVFRKLALMRWQPAIRIAPPYHDDPAYIEALASSVRDALAGLDFQPDRIVASFHGIPQSYFDKGDPYFCHCAKTTRLLGEALGLGRDRLLMAFQSRFGPAKWLEPYMDDMLKKLPAEGVRRIAVVTPGFSADCLETIEEIGIEGEEIFLHSGGEKYHRIACLNDSEAGMRAIGLIVRRELGGWIDG
jgi:ferrochelatase